MSAFVPMRVGRSATMGLLAVATLAGCSGRNGSRDGPGTEAVRDVGAPAGAGGAVDAYIRPTADAGALVQGDTIEGLPSWTREDWEVAKRTLEWAWEEGLDTLPIGERLVRIGLTFVGTPYIPQTLDPPGPERVVINLRALDCVTYVESMLVLAHFLRRAERDILARPEDAMRLYQEILTTIRYREGRIGDYASRLHYFTEWIRDNESKGFVRDMTRDLGGIVDSEPITFMSAHRSAYRQLADSGQFDKIGPIEVRLSSTPRYYVPEERAAQVAAGIQNGDVIAMTSTLPGLDVAHTGIAYWKDGAVHLLNAPLVGKSVELSEKPIPERLLGLRAQDGLMVARPLERLRSP